MKKLLTLTLFLGIVGLVSAQTALEAFRYAFLNYNGTARYSAVGGAFTSLGGDITVASTNPAGLAIFRKSTGAFTPGITTNTLKGKNYNSTTSSFIVPSFGFVFSTPITEDSNIKNFNFGFSYTQGANYDQLYKYQENNSSYTILEEITKDLNSYNENNPNNKILPKELQNGGNYPSVASLAYNTGLIDYIENNGKKYYDPNIFGDEKVNALEQNENNGQSGEYALSIAANFNHKFYLGATVGLQSIYFERIQNYQEAVQTPTQNNIVKKFFYDKYLKVIGAGINFKIGGIYRVNNNIRLGFSIHTPTYIEIEEQYAYTMESITKTGNTKKTSPSNGNYANSDYSYSTPWRFSVGGSYIFGRKGFISIDYEWIDYSTMKFYANNIENVNTTIKNNYGSSNTIKIGAELKLSRQFSLRGGYNYISNMYTKRSNKEQDFNIISGGLGYKSRNFFIDCSYQHLVQNLDTQISSNVINNQQYIAKIIKLTVGFQF